MRVYIAGKITGEPGYQEKFAELEARLREKGHVVLTPAVLPEGMEPGDYMRICLAMLDTAEAVAFLPGWETSGGAKLERSWCEYIGKAVIDGGEHG